MTMMIMMTAIIMMRMVASIYGNTDLDDDTDAIVVILKFMKPQLPKKNIRRPHHHRYKYHCHPKATSRGATQDKVGGLKQVEVVAHVVHHIPDQC